MIFIAEDIREHNVVVPFLDQAHGDARNRGRNGHARIHERQARTAHAGHGTGAVRLGDFRDDPRHVGEAVRIRQNGLHAPPCQSPVTDLAALRTGHERGLADAIGREIVVEHELVLALALQRIDDLRIPPRAQCGDHQRLGFAPGKERRTVSPRQQADLHIDWPDLPRFPPVDPRPSGKYAPADNGLLKAAELRFDLPDAPVGSIVARQRLDQIVPDVREPRAASLLLHDAVGVAHPIAGLAFHGRRQKFVGLGLVPVEWLRSRFGRQFIDRADGRLHLLVPVQDGTEHDLLRKHIGFRLHHQHRVSGTGHHQVQIRLRHGGHARIGEVRAVSVTHAHGADRPLEGQP